MSILSYLLSAWVSNIKVQTIKWCERCERCDGIQINNSTVFYGCKKPSLLRYDWRERQKRKGSHKRFIAVWLLLGSTKIIIMLNWTIPESQTAQTYQQFHRRLYDLRTIARINLILHEDSIHKWFCHGVCDFFSLFFFCLQIDVRC